MLDFKVLDIVERNKAELNYDDIYELNSNLLNNILINFSFLNLKTTNDGVIEVNTIGLSKVFRLIKAMSEVQLEGKNDTRYEENIIENLREFDDIFSSQIVIEDGTSSFNLFFKLFDESVTRSVVLLDK